MSEEMTINEIYDIMNICMMKKPSDIIGIRKTMSFNLNVLARMATTRSCSGGYRHRVARILWSWRKCVNHNITAVCCNDCAYAAAPAWRHAALASPALSVTAVGAMAGRVTGVSLVIIMSQRNVSLIERKPSSRCIERMYS